MVSSDGEEQSPLLDQRVVAAVVENEQNMTHDTFASESNSSRLTGDGDNSKGIDDVEDLGYGWKEIIMITSTWIGVLLASIDMSVMATLTGPISESFESFHLLTWFINGYTVTSALVQPLSGKLSDIYGRRNCLLVSNFLFMLGNLICGLATEPWHFIMGRAIGGLGGGCIHSISTFLASDVIPLRSRGFWQGLSNIAYALGYSLGGAMGGAINDAVGWKWAFLFQPVPILVSMILVWWLVPHSTQNRDKKQPSLKQIDFLGSAILTLAILSLMFGAVSGGNTLPWSSPLVYVPLAISPLLLLAFAYLENKVAKHPVIPIQLLLTRSIGGACLTNFVCTTANTALTYYSPLAMEIKGLPPAEAGLRQVSQAAGAFLGSLGAGILMNKTGKYYWLCLSCLATITVAALSMLLTLQHITGWIPFVLLFVNGFGFGGMLVTTLLALVSAADHSQHALMTSASYAFRSAGNTMGITIAGAIFQNIFGRLLWEKFGNSKQASWLIPAIRRRQVDLNDLPAGWKSKVLECYDASFRSVFTFVVAGYFLGTITVSIIRENRLSKSLDRSK